MKNFLLGSVNKKKSRENKEKHFYELELFYGNIKEKFENKNKMIAFLRKHATGLLNTLETSYVRISYNLGKKDEKYLVFAKNLETKQIIAYEQTKYEFIEANKYFFKNTANYRNINERKCRFTDVVRSSFWCNSTSAFFSLIISSSFFLFSAIFYSLFSESLLTENNIEDKLKIMEFALITIGLPYSFFVTCFFFYSNVLIPLKRNLKEEDLWRKLSFKKNLISLVIIFSTALFMPFVIYFVSTFSNHILLGNFFIFILYFYISLTLIIGIIELLKLIFSFFIIKNKFKWYFNNSDWKKFKNWYINGESKYLKIKPKEYKATFLENKNINLINSIESNFSSEISRKYTNQEIKIYKSKIFFKNNLAVKKYLELLGYENYDNSEKIIFK